MAISNLMPLVELKPITYPESDGKPMADNTKQFNLITTIQGNLDLLFKDDPQVLVVGDLLWYPLERHPKIRVAPDVMVVFGRTKGHRGSYLQWKEDHIAPQVAFEILSPGNTAKEMTLKFRFYEQHGVEEYYLYDPDRGRLEGWQRQRGHLAVIRPMNGWVSPRLNIRFELQDLDLALFYPDGKRFLSFLELGTESRRWADLASREAARASREATRASREAQARQQAEARIKMLEAKLKQAGLL